MTAEHVAVFKHLVDTMKASAARGEPVILDADAAGALGDLLENVLETTLADLTKDRKSK